MTERELSQATHLKAELDALRRVAAEEGSEDVLRAIDRQEKAVESARLEVMAFIAAIPDARVRAIAVMRFLEGKSWETIARRMHYERTSPAKQLRRFLRGTISLRPIERRTFLSPVALTMLGATLIFREVTKIVNRPRSYIGQCFSDSRLQLLVIGVY